MTRLRVELPHDETDETKRYTLADPDALADAYAVALDVLRSIADALGLGVVEPPAASRSTCALAAARLAREAGEVIADAYEASADGEITPAEGARLERQCDDAIPALLEVREHARAAVATACLRIGSVRRAR
ncbi:MAG: hypothetical protein IT374_26515 [Polyangiaceae bacterium]|nr:hypothetical protein [Polyangiaceae bacterium]